MNYHVRRDGVRVGRITRTKHGSVFEYDDDVVAHDAEEGIAFGLPYAQRRFETLGVNLHSFFANLLPEGLRLRALVRRLKRSEDDLLSLLAAVGHDCIGDVSVVPEGAADEAPQPSLDASKTKDVRFGDLLEESLAYSTGRSKEPTVPGAQEKVSAAMISFPVKGAAHGRAYILKLNPADKPNLVENEDFFLRMAAACGLETCSATRVVDRDGASGLLVERFDRILDPEGKRMRQLHQEDACQLLDRYPADKYLVDCRAIGEAIVRVTTAPAIEALRYLQLWAFSYVIANGDLHAKNVSVQRRVRDVRLTPAYDLLTTLPYGDRHMALKVGARDDNLRARDFTEIGERLGVRTKATTAMLAALTEKATPWVERFGEIGFDSRRTKDLERVARKRLRELHPGA